MALRKSVFKIFGVTSGCLGIAVCVALALVCWWASVRLDEAVDRLAEAIERSLAAVRQRAIQIQARIVEAKITTKEIEQSLRQWTRRAARERLELQLDTARATERLTSGLRNIEDWLEFSESALALVQDLRSIQTWAGTPSSTSSVADLTAELGSLRVHLADATSAVAKLDATISGANEEKSLDQRIEQAVQLALRIMGTLTSVDTRLGKQSDRLAAVHDELHELKTTTRRWILIVTSGISMFFLWMAAGQAALCRLACNRSR